MNPELLALAPGAAGLTATGLQAAVRRRPEERVTFGLLPREGSEVDLAAWPLFFRSLYGIAAPAWRRLIFGQPSVSLELWSQDELLTARCHAPRRLQHLLMTHLSSAAPGLRIAESAAEFELPEPAARTALRLQREPIWSLAAQKGDSLGRVAAALAAAPHAVLQLALMPDVGWERRARRGLQRLQGSSGGPLDQLFDSVLPKQGHLEREVARASTAKAETPGFAVELRLRVSAATSAEAKTRMHALVSAFRALDGENGLRPRRVWRARSFDRAILQRRPPAGRIVLTAEELAGLYHLPCAGAAFASAPVQLSPGRLAPGSGKMLCLADDGRQTPIAIAQEDCRQHIHVLGPTGSGKSTLLLQLALQDILAGRGVGVIDPKGDLIRALLERIPASEAHRIRLIDPAAKGWPVGLNVLECEDPDLRELVADQVVAVFKKSYERFWGPRTDDILRAALLTLLRHPGTTLCEVPLLLLRPEVRKRYTKELGDPVGLQPFWTEYEAMGEGQRLQMVGPLLNKLRAFLLRPTVRNMLGQPTSTIDLRQAIDNRQIVLVSLAKGLLGEETSRLLGSFIFARLWQTALGRADRLEEARPDFNLYLDEFQNYLSLPQNLDDVLVEARSYHLDLVLANQHLGQLQTSTRDALDANARTRVVFQSGQEDARTLAREFQPWLGERELRNLQRFQVAVRLCRGGRTEPPFTGSTCAAPASLAEAAAAAQLTQVLGACGRPRTEVESAINKRFERLGFKPSQLDQTRPPGA